MNNKDKICAPPGADEEKESSRRMTLTEVLTTGASAAPVSFHMPGHKGTDFFRRNGFGNVVDRLADMDITEIPGADNLFIRDGVIGELENRWRKLLGADCCRILVNGSTCGLEAAIMAVTRPGQPVIIARNCHRSVLNGVFLAGGRPVFLYPEEVSVEGCYQSRKYPAKHRTECAVESDTPGSVTGVADTGYSDIHNTDTRDADTHGSDTLDAGIGGSVTRDFDIRESDIIYEYSRFSRGITAPAVVRALEETPDASAVVITRPDYYGFMPDIKEIAGAVHDYGKILIVDQAHGAHLPFMKDSAGESLGADALGADISVSSIHKTLSGFTQTSVLTFRSDRADPGRIDRALAMLETSSPSYLLMLSLDVTAGLMEERGDRLIGEWLGDLAWFRNEASSVPGLRVITSPDMDQTKLLVSFYEKGMTGQSLEKALEARNIIPEMSDEKLALLMTGIGNKRYDYERLISALREISETLVGKRGEPSKNVVTYHDSVNNPREPSKIVEPDYDSGAGRRKSTKNVVASSKTVEPDYDSGAGRRKTSKNVAASSKTAATSTKFAVTGQNPSGRAWDPYRSSDRLARADIPAEIFRIPLESAEGMVAADSVIPYPPGIPVFCPGDVISKRALDYVRALLMKGVPVLGIDNERRILAGKPDRVVHQ